MLNLSPKAPKLSVILPCRNEEKALPFCIQEIKNTIKKHKIKAEVIVSDSSTDKSPEIARKHNTVLVKHDKVGYGIAYLEGIKKAKGKYLFLADADSTYNFQEIPNFLKYLEEGHDFVIGNRFNKHMEKNAMPWAHKYIGNPGLSFILRLLTGSKVKDAHCGMRAIKKSALNKLNLKTTGMEFASEMVMKAHEHKLKIKQIPIKYRSRKGKAHLNPIKDGLRHIKFMVNYTLSKK